MSIAYAHEWMLVPRKDGKPARRCVQVTYAYCPLNVCQRCGAMGGDHRVRYRSDVYLWNVPGRDGMESEGLHTLCVACWNVARGVIRRVHQLYELGRLARKLEREAANAKQG